MAGKFSKGQKSQFSDDFEVPWLEEGEIPPIPEDDLGGFDALPDDVGFLPDEAPEPAPTMEEPVAKKDNLLDIAKMAGGEAISKASAAISNPNITDEQMAAELGMDIERDRLRTQEEKIARGVGGTGRFDFPASTPTGHFQEYKKRQENEAWRDAGLEEEGDFFDIENEADTGPSQFIKDMDDWDTVEEAAGVNSFEVRADKLATTLENDPSVLQGVIKTSEPTAITDVYQSMQAYAAPDKPGAAYKVDPALHNIASVAIDGVLFGETLAAAEYKDWGSSDDGTKFSAEDKAIADAAAETLMIGPHGGTVQQAGLDQRIAKAIEENYRAYKRQEGVEIPPLDRKQRAVLGAAYRNLYTKLNPNMVKPLGNKQMFITPLGYKRLKESRNELAAITAKKPIEPSHVPLRGNEALGIEPGVQPGDLGNKEKTKGKVKIRQREKGQQKITEFQENAGSVPMIVDPRKFSMTAIALAAGLQAVQFDSDQYSQSRRGGNRAEFSIVSVDSESPVGTLANAVGVGPKKMNKFAADHANSTKAEKGYDGNRVAATFIEGQYRAFKSAAENYNKANYIPMFHHTYNDRFYPETTHFNVNASKIIRHLVRNVTPSVVRKGSKQEGSFKEMITRKLIKGGDKLLPSAARKMFDEQIVNGLLASDARYLRDKLDGLLGSDGAQEIADAVKQNGTLPPEIGQIASQLFDPANMQDARILEIIRDRGDTGLDAIDGLVELANYNDAMANGNEYSTYLTDHIDGITNGPSAKGILLGNKDQAYRSGVLRNVDNGGLILDDGDIRDDLQMRLLGDDGETGGIIDDAIAGLDNNNIMYEVAGEARQVMKRVFQERELAKTTTMVATYGRDKMAFNEEIETFVYEVMQDDLVFRGLWDSMLDKVGHDNQAELLKVMRDVYNEGLTASLSSAAFDIAKVERHSVYMAAMMGTTLDYTSYIGSRIAVGGTVNTGLRNAEIDKINVAGEEVEVAHLKSRQTAGALKPMSKADIEAGKKPRVAAMTSIIPQSVQTTDASTLVEAFTGNRYKELSKVSEGNPFFFTVHDAAYTDVNGFSTVRKNMNDSWIEVLSKWSPWEEYNKDIRNKLNYVDKLTPGSEVDISEESPHRIAGQLMGLKLKEDTGKFASTALQKFIYDVTPAIKYKGRPTSRLNSDEARQAIGRAANEMWWYVKTGQVGLPTGGSFSARVEAEGKKRGWILQQPTKMDKTEYKRLLKVIRDPGYFLNRQGFTNGDKVKWDTMMDITIRKTNKGKAEIIKEIRAQEMRGEDGEVLQYS